MASFLPYGRQSIDADDIAAVVEVLKSDILTTGPKVGEFERAFAARVGADYAVACANGTAALHLASMAARLGHGDIAVTPTLTFLATVNAPHYTGAEVVFADADPDTALVTPEILEETLASIKSTVKTVFVVHMNGQCCDMEAIGQIAKARGSVVIEDACHAIGTTYKSRDGTMHIVGACHHSDMTCFSLHPLKTLTMGEGGVVTTNNSVYYEAMRRLRTHGMVREPDRFVCQDQAFGDDGSLNPWYYEMPEPGYNYRVSDIQCALGLSQLHKLDTFGAKRKALARYYDVVFAGLSGPIKAFKRSSYCDPLLHLYVLLIDFAEIAKSRGRVMRELQEQGIGTQVHYLPVHRQPYYANRYGPQRMPGAEAYYNRALSIPLHPVMTEADAERVSSTVRGVLAGG